MLMRRADAKRKKSGNKTFKKPHDVKIEERITRDERAVINQTKSSVNSSAIKKKKNLYV